MLVRRDLVAAFDDTCPEMYSSCCQQISYAVPHLLIQLIPLFLVSYLSDTASIYYYYKLCGYNSKV